jgi:LVIVD repeat
MHRWRRYALITIGAVTLVAGALPVGAEHKTFPRTKNMHALGHSVHPGTFAVPDGQRKISSDLAFWGSLAFQGNYDGFRVIDISEPGSPVLVSHPKCNGDQGDIVVWDGILVRGWNGPAPAGRTCMDQPVPVGFEGVHVFDVSDPANPTLLTAVEFSQAGAATRGTADGCGSHTLTLAPDLGNDRVIVYSNNSSGGGREVCDSSNIIEVPLGNPAASSHIGYVPMTDGTLGTNNGCHDAGVILGDVNLMACASGHAANVFSIGPPRGGSLENPQFLYSIEEEEVHEGDLIKVGAPQPAGQEEHHSGRWHSAAFTWDGEVIILGWEPGGGTQAECTEHDAPINKSAYFYDADTGADLGRWTLPRDQGEDENCTIHNYNMVPTKDGRYILTVGNYQAGTWVVDFTNPASPTTLGWADPPSLGPGPFCDPDAGGPAPPTCQLGGAWSSYWYNGFIYESDITRGLAVYKFSGRQVAGALKFDHLNPQTQEISLG